MNRRRLLASAVGTAVALPGCLGSLPAAPGPEVSFPAVTARGDPVPSTVDAALTVTVARQFGPDDPARVRVAYTNTAAEERQVYFGTVVPFPPYSGTRVDGPGRLSLVPDDREFVSPHPRPEKAAGDAFVPEEPSRGCWRALASVAGADMARRRVLGPDETVDGTFSVLAHPDSDGCLASGTFRFEDDGYFEEGRPWGFALELEG